MDKRTTLVDRPTDTKRETREGGEAAECPFCGRADLLGVEPSPEDGGFLSVKCRACGARGPCRTAADADEAIALWNRRACAPGETERAAAEETR